MKISRRELGAALGGLVLLPACQSLPRLPLPDEDPPARLTVEVHGSGSARVVEARWAAAVDEQGQVDAARVEELLGAALSQLIGPRPFAEWSGSRSRIGIKVNTITSQAFTHPQLAGALARGLVEAGSDPTRVTVWDRDTFGLRDRGYLIDQTGRQNGYRCLGTDLAAGQSRPLLVAGDKVWLSPLAEQDLLINVAALKDHSMAGVSLTLKNNFGMIHGAERLHGDARNGSGCEPGISELAALPDLRDRLGLGVIDALVGVCEGGPGLAQPAHVFRHAGILVSRDPVALDRRGLAIIEARRARLGLSALVTRSGLHRGPPVHIENAAARGVSPG